MIHQHKVATPSDDHHHHHHLRRTLRRNRRLMSAKGCEEYGDCRRRKFYRRAFGCVLAFIVLVLFVILVIFLVLRPSKPKFYIQDATVYQLNLSGNGPPAGVLLTTTMQVTVSSRNPNDRIGIYYDKLDVFVSYKNQQVTVPSALPRGYQGHNDVTVWSPYLYGAAVPVAPYVAALLGQDQNAGYVLLYVKIQGRLRWKVGSWISGRYHIDVSCPAFLTICGGGGGCGSSPSAYRFQHISSCSVDV